MAFVHLWLYQRHQQEVDIVLIPAH